ncbi:FAD-binding dehydrogenase [Rhizobium sp. P44RR-XXIV]|uniref:FAD-binding dehydrogenase n=1 Tax=Rhizobium sp. P44RR-XXIV TaxID=1921145 RepID=UPI000985A091|nr:FAD-binding dehydrogenase [Rhizobium sp. P44RR-XXIV]TIX90299.1 FAD-binding dehydrogenase [Rhizobium sp. P44RR-XXIV]
MSTTEPDVIVVGAGLAGLVATYELVKAGRKVLVIDQENRNNLGGQAFWSLGGLFLVDSPEQRRMRIKDSYDLALQDWMGSAQFDRAEDYWPRKWAEAYLRFATDEKRTYLHELGVRFVPTVGWAERGDGNALGHGNSVPRFHLTWGTGPELVRVFREPVLDGERRGLVRFAFRHQVDELIVEQGAVVGVRGTVLEPCDDLERGKKSPRNGVESFEYRAPAVVLSTGGIGHNLDLIRRNWPTDRLGEAPKHMIPGVPAHVDGRMLGIAETSGANIINRDRMWHYVEGIHNWDPIWPDHAIRIIPGPSPLWLDANGDRMEAPNFPGFNTLGTLKRILSTGHDYSWFILNESIIGKEFVLSGSEQNPDITGKDIKLLLRSRLSKRAPGPIEAFKRSGIDFVVRNNLRDLVAGMNELVRGPRLDYDHVERQVLARDRESENKYSKDAQLIGIMNARRYFSDRLRILKPHRLLDPKRGPLIAVRLNILTRKTLGGIETNLGSQVMRSDGSPFPGLYAAGEAAGFGGGGVHGYNALEGTFLGGCIFSGRAAGRAIAGQRTPSR